MSKQQFYLSCTDTLRNSHVCQIFCKIQDAENYLFKDIINPTTVSWKMPIFQSKQAMNK